MKNKKEKPDCELWEIFSYNVTYYRKAAGMKQFDLAQKAGFSHNFINDLENSKKGASFKTVERLAKALNVEPFFLFIDPNDRFSGENHKLIGILNAVNKNVDSFFEYTIKELAGDKEKPHKNGKNSAPRA